MTFDSVDVQIVVRSLDSPASFAAFKGPRRHTLVALAAMPDFPAFTPATVSTMAITSAIGPGVVAERIIVAMELGFVIETRIKGHSEQIAHGLYLSGTVVRMVGDLVPLFFPFVVSITGGRSSFEDGFNE